MASMQRHINKLSNSVYRSGKKNSPTVKERTVVNESPIQSHCTSPRCSLTQQLAKDHKISSPLFILSLAATVLKPSSSPSPCKNSTSSPSFSPIFTDRQYITHNSLDSSNKYESIKPNIATCLFGKLQESLEREDFESFDRDGNSDDHFNESSNVEERTEIELDTPTRQQVITGGLDSFPRKLPVIGQGGFGTVIKAVHKGVKVAAKIICKTRRRRISIDYCLAGEMNAMNLSHPNIIRTLGVFGFKDPNALVLMEFAGPTNLQRILDDNRQILNWERRLNFSAQIAEALNCCHMHNMAHLDVKPANIIVSAGDSCKLGDFGCSTQLDNNKPYQSTFPLDGTVAYKAPELLQGKVPTAKADIYSYGITLWQILTREIPFAQMDPHVIIYRVVKCDCRPSIPKLTEPASISFANLFTRCWSTVVDQRPSSHSILKQLNRLASDG